MFGISDAGLFLRSAKDTLGAFTVKHPFILEDLRYPRGLFPLSDGSFLYFVPGYKGKLNKLDSNYNIVWSVNSQSYAPYSGTFGIGSSVSIIEGKMCFCIYSYENYSPSYSEYPYRDWLFEVSLDGTQSITTFRSERKTNSYTPPYRIGQVVIPGTSDKKILGTNFEWNGSIVELTAFENPPSRGIQFPNGLELLSITKTDSGSLINLWNYNKKCLLKVPYTYNISFTPRYIDYDRKVASDGNLKASLSELQSFVEEIANFIGLED